MKIINLTKEVMKAETQLRRVRRNAKKAIDATTMKWLQKEVDLIATFSPEALDGLRRLEILPNTPKELVFDLTPDDIEGPQAITEMMS